MCRDTLTWSANPPISRYSSVSRLVSVASRSPRPRACNGAWCPAPIQMFLRRGSALVPWTRIRLARPGLLHLTVQTHPMHPISASTVDYLHVLRAKHTPSLCPSDDIRRSDHRPLRRTNSCISDRQTTRAAMQRRERTDLGGFVPLIPSHESPHQVWCERGSSSNLATTQVNVSPFGGST